MICQGDESRELTGSLPESARRSEPVTGPCSYISILTDIIRHSRHIPVRTVERGHRRCASSVPRTSACSTSTGAGSGPSASNRLSAREREVFLLIGLGLSNADLVRQLHVTERTVKAHVSRIIAKLGLPRSKVTVVAALHIAEMCTAVHSPESVRMLN